MLGILRSADINGTIKVLDSKLCGASRNLFLKCKLLKRGHERPVTGFSQHFSEASLAQPLQHEARY